MKPTIAIIGAGSMGSGLATRLASKSYRLLLFDQEVQKAQELAERIYRATSSADVEAIDCQVNASWEADIIVLAIPESSKKGLAERIRPVATCKIVISLSVASTDLESKRVDFVSTHTGGELQQWLPNSNVVNVLMTSRFTPFLTQEEIATVCLSGGHLGALTTVSGLVQAAGLNPVIVEDWSVGSEQG